MSFERIDFGMSQNHEMGYDMAPHIVIRWSLQSNVFKYHSRWRNMDQYILSCWVISITGLIGYPPQRIPTKSQRIHLIKWRQKNLGWYDTVIIFFSIDFPALQVQANNSIKFESNVTVCPLNNYVKIHFQQMIQFHFCFLSSQKTF